MVKGLEGVRHLMEDFNVEKILLLVTHQSGSTKAIECCSNADDEDTPIIAISCKDFTLLDDAALVEPQLNMVNCKSFFNYIAECVHDLIREKQSDSPYRPLLLKHPYHQNSMAIATKF